MDDDTQPCLTDKWLTHSEQEDHDHLIQQMKQTSVCFDPKPSLERENCTQNPPPDDSVQTPRQDLNAKVPITCEPVPDLVPPQMHVVLTSPPEPPLMPTTHHFQLFLKILLALSMIVVPTLGLIPALDQPANWLTQLPPARGVIDKLQKWQRQCVKVI